MSYLERIRKRAKKSDTLVPPTDKTDKKRVLSALSVPPQGHPENIEPVEASSNAPAVQSSDTQGVAGDYPYRIALDGHAQLVWLEPGLSPPEMVERARAIYGAERVADPGIAPAGGWPNLRDIPELPDLAALLEGAAERAAIQEHEGGLSREDADRAALVAWALVRCEECAHFTPDAIGDGAGIGRCALNAWRLGQPALWPWALRRCDSHQPRESTP